ncbi:putative Dyggve Melchior Clausen syndrome protein [Trypanosoma vivax]|uniref:Dymeclin n=1 Tax=Trypanosoma vivax (strain Y486) TaxID=1055687 RepID=G0U207_TRYVY|nr:hypothetical protein TRVL_04746 [Trypanosoma vivax]KAH8618715.1 putative Dyggve Melchior Clausen syndrome protein [Trypanosoma vivax]CCC50309.1 conserved hypothetical protein [Trypanosoma vivax Y486]
MGGASTKEALPYFTSLANDETEPDEKEFADHLTRYKADLCSGAELYVSLLPALQELVPLCAPKGRILWLIRFCLHRIEQVTCNYSQGPDDAFTAAIHIMQFVVRYAHTTSSGDATRFLEIISVSAPTEARGSGGDLEDHVDGCAGGDDSQWANHEAHKLCVALMDFCVAVPLTQHTVEAHAEVVTLLLCMNSSALYHDTSLDGGNRDFFTELMLSYKGLSDFLVALLQRLGSWGAGSLPQTPLLYRQGQQSAFRAFYNMFFDGSNRESIGCGAYLGRRSAQLLAVLVAYGKGYRPNPTLEFLAGITDGAPIAYGLLLNVFTTHLSTCPVLCIVLYVLLYDNPSFIHTVTTTYSKELLEVLQAVLHLCHVVTVRDDPAGAFEGFAPPEASTAAAQHVSRFASPFIGCMTATLLLIFSQDQVVNKHMSELVISPPFKMERFTGMLSLLSLYVIVVARAIVRALNDKSELLVSILIPCLVNVSPFVRNIEVYTSQRLVQLLLLVQRKLRRLLELYVEQGNSTDVVSGNPDVAKEERNRKCGEIAVLVRQFSGLVEALDGMVKGGDRHNDSLVYEFLYHRLRIEEGVHSKGLMSPFSKAVHRALQPLLKTMGFYVTEIASFTSSETSRDVLAVIRRVMQEGGSSASSHHQSFPRATEASESKLMSTQCTSLKSRDIAFLYEESVQSYDFFGPFVWATLLGEETAYPGGISWTTDVSTLSIFPSS